MGPVQDFSNYGLLSAFLAALALFMGFLSFAVVYMVRDRREERAMRQAERAALAVEREAERKAREQMARDCHAFQVATLDRYDESQAKVIKCLDKNTEMLGRAAGALERHEGVTVRLEQRLKQSHPAIQITEPRHVAVSDSGVKIDNPSDNVHG